MIRRRDMIPLIAAMGPVWPSIAPAKDDERVNILTAIDEPFVPMAPVMVALASPQPSWAERPQPEYLPSPRGGMSVFERSTITRAERKRRTRKKKAAKQMRKGKR